MTISHKKEFEGKGRNGKVWQENREISRTYFYHKHFAADTGDDGLYQYSGQL